MAGNIVQAVASVKNFQEPQRHVGSTCRSHRPTNHAGCYRSNQPHSYLLVTLSRLSVQMLTVSKQTLVRLQRARKPKLGHNPDMSPVE